MVIYRIAIFYLLIILSIVVFENGQAFTTLMPDVAQRVKLSRTMLGTSSGDDWSSFQALDDDEVLGIAIDRREYAVEDDDPKVKAEVGSGLAPPSIERDADPIQVPVGSQLELDEDTVLGVLAACRAELGTLFGYTAENRGVGITGGVDYVELDGPTVIVKLKGRFWHQRTTVLDRVTNYLQQRIPEIVSVQVEDPWQLTDEANEVW